MTMPGPQPIYQQQVQRSVAFARNAAQQGLLNARDRRPRGPASLVGRVIGFLFTLVFTLVFIAIAIGIVLAILST
jgi:hypothetical protein